MKRYSPCVSGKTEDELGVSFRESEFGYLVMYEEVQKLEEELTALKADYNLLKQRMYNEAADTCNDCQFKDYYDGILCMISGNYVDDFPSTECKKYKVEMKQYLEQQSQKVKE